MSTYTYGFADQVATPVANYASGELEVGTTVTFSCETEGATIYYRTDGVDPDPSRVQELEVYTGPIAVSRATTFKVIAVMDHMQDSRILTAGVYSEGAGSSAGGRAGGDAGHHGDERTAAEPQKLF